MNDWEFCSTPFVNTVHCYLQRQYFIWNILFNDYKINLFLSKYIVEFVCLTFILTIIIFICYIILSLCVCFPTVGWRCRMKMVRLWIWSHLFTNKVMWYTKVSVEKEEYTRQKRRIVSRSTFSITAKKNFFLGIT